MTVTLPPADVRTCEACWIAPVTAVRRTEAGRDLLCAECADGDCPRRRIERGKHGSGPPPTFLPRVSPA
ncbi:hypothetical protein ACF1D2_12785 [Streptomyces bacillaris]|uniref:hypothetical protein n=1 Tax=Streptomyces bacillaris TaxID=68179 RepID=UPI0037016339